LGEELKKEFNADIELIAGSNGVFEISVNGKTVFSKSQARRFPGPGEIASLIRNH